MIGRSFKFRGYGASVCVDVPDGVSMADLRRHVAPEITVEEVGRERADLLLTRWEGVYRLVLGEKRYGPYRTIDNAFRGLSNGIHFVLGKRSPMTFLHAGAVEIDGSAVVFPGRSHWGKSTLVASLVDQGCGYLSDEYAVVSPEGSIHPLSKPIRLRREGGGVDFSSPPGVSAPGGLPCIAAVLTRYERGAVWDPTALTRGSAILAILPAALKSREEPESVLKALIAMVSDASLYESPRGDGEPTLDSLLGLHDGFASRLSTGARA